MYKVTNKQFEVLFRSYIFLTEWYLKKLNSIKGKSWLGWLAQQISKINWFNTYWYCCWDHYDRIEIIKIEQKYYPRIKGFEKYKKEL